MSAVRVGRLHCITDTSLQKRFSHKQLVKMALRAKVPVIQYRNKNPIDAKALTELQQIVESVRKAEQCCLIINDHVHLAAQLHADGVHIGQEDLSLEETAKVLNEGQIIGVSIHSAQELRKLLSSPFYERVHYIGVGPVYGTYSKGSRYLPPMSSREFAKICAMSPFPVIAIGGITKERVYDVMAQGAYGVAVLSAFACAEDPYSAAMELMEAVHSAVDKLQSTR